MIWSAVGVFLGGYVIGGIPFGLIVARALKGIDIREHGSGNIGATNVMRVVGRGAGIGVFLLDVFKGFLPAFIAMRFGGSILGILGGLGALAGHILPPWLRFRGGRGVATGLGVFLGLTPIGVGICFGIWGIVFLLSRYVSLASIVAALAFPLILLGGRAMGLREYSLGVMILALVAVAAVLLRHIPNMKRLFRGEESKFRRGGG